MSNHIHGLLRVKTVSVARPKYVSKSSSQHLETLESHIQALGIL